MLAIGALACPGSIADEVDADGGPGLGDLCDSCEEASDCAGTTNLCLRFDTGELFCGQDCAADRLCPTNYACVEISNLPGTWQCTPATATCGGVSSDCDPPCQGNEVCVQGECVVSADCDPPCQGTDVCVQGECVGAGCDPPCGGNEVCFQGECIECDPGYLGPFCEQRDGKRRVIGFEPPYPETPSLAEARTYSVDAVNRIRAMTCLPPLAQDACLNDIGAAALDAVSTLGIHGYFLAHCMNAAHDYGDDCECDWAQENYGMASGTSRDWSDGVHAPLCGMMDEPKGVGHRSNIESAEWIRLGVGIDIMSSGAAWCHEFGR